MVMLLEAADELQIRLLGGLSGIPIGMLSAQAQWTVRRLKTEVANVEGTPVPNQCLMAGGRLLSDAETLSAALTKDEQHSVSLVRVKNEQLSECGAKPKDLAISECDHGGFRVQWTVDGKRLRRNERQVVSPSFELDFGEDLTQRLEFAILLRPSQGVSFQRSKGKGCIELKCMHSWPRRKASVKVAAAVGGSGTAGTRTCGTVVHDFDASAFCRLSQQHKDLDFLALTDPRSMSFVVTLEFERVDSFA